MNKKLVVLALVLLLAVGGLFAEGIIFGNMNSSVDVILQAAIGNYFYHGIVENENGPYLGSKIITDAFGAAAPSFRYGYETNAASGSTIKMSISNFENQTSGVGGVVKIKDITVVGTGATMTWDDAATEKNYTIFTVDLTNTYDKKSATITVYPAKLETDTTDHRSAAVADVETVAKAPAGEYEATVTFKVSGS